MRPDRHSRYTASRRQWSAGREGASRRDGKENNPDRKASNGPDGHQAICRQNNKRKEARTSPSESAACDRDGTL